MLNVPMVKFVGELFLVLFDIFLDLVRMNVACYRINWRRRVTEVDK